MEALRIRGLRKSFDKLEVLRGLDMSVQEGTIYGFLGRNGAGKTTTMKIVTGLCSADGGTVELLGERSRFGGGTANRRVGYLPDAPQFYGYMTGQEYLALCGDICGLRRTESRAQSESLLKMTGLWGVERKIKTYSRGMKQRLGIAQALMGNPDIVFCDEPTSALDPDGRRELLEIIRGLKGRTTVVFSTHILSDVERICDTVGVLNEGIMVLERPIRELRSGGAVERIELELFDEQHTDKFAGLLSGQSGVVSMWRRGCTVTVAAEDARKLSERICALAVESGTPLRRMERMERTLEDIFMEATRAAAERGQ